MSTSPQALIYSSYIMYIFNSYLYNCTHNMQRYTENQYSHTEIPYCCYDEISTAINNTSNMAYTHCQDMLFSQDIGKKKQLTNALYVCMYIYLQDIFSKSNYVLLMDRKTQEGRVSAGCNVVVMYTFLCSWKPNENDCICYDALVESPWVVISDKFKFNLTLRIFTVMVQIS